MADEHARHPDAERQQPHRAHLRASRRARLRGGRRWGQDAEPEFLAEGPRAPHADARGGRAAARDRCGRAARSCSTSATSTASTSSIRPIRRAGDGRQRDVLSDRHAVSGAGARHLPEARLPPVPRRGGDLRRRRRDQGAGPAGCRGRDRRAARGLREFFIDGKTFIGGDSPSIADIRLAATLEFLRAIDYEFPDWAKDVHVRGGVVARRGLLGAGRRTCAASSHQ